MNESLINPFQIGHPTAVQTSLYAYALFSRFDTTGRYIATGRFDGSAGIWDLETRAQIRVLDGHVKAVTSLDWSKNSRYLMTSSKDWNVIIWYLASEYEPPQRHSTIRFDAPVLRAEFHPRNSRIVLVLLSTGEAYLVDLRKNYRSRVELYETLEEGEEDQSTRSRSAMTSASFHPSGKYVFVGTAAGSLLVFNTRTKAMIARHRIAGAGTVKGMDFSKTGRRIVTNSSDRVLRQFNVPNYTAPAALSVLEKGGIVDHDLEPTQRFNDPINKTAWHTMSYSPDGEWLAGGAADPATHKIYIWDISNDGQFASALDGGREPLAYVHWHPTKSIIASTTKAGSILIWHCPSPERWGAFAGGFEEVDENVEYQEREDEFDIEDEEDMTKRKAKEEEQEVDIDTMDVVGPNPSISHVNGKSNNNANNVNGTPTPAIKTEPNTEETVTGGGVNGVDSMNVDGRQGSALPQLHLQGQEDEDVAWAEDEPDDDLPGWKMKIVMEDDMDL